MKLQINHNIKVFIFPVLLTSLLSLVQCESAQKKEDKITWTKGSGEAIIYQNDINLAKDRALRLAKRDAINRKLGELIRSKTVVSSGVWVRGEIVAKTEGLVNKYLILSEKNNDEVLTLKIKAVVDEVRLKDVSAQIIASMEKPVMFITIDHKIRGKSVKSRQNITTSDLSKTFLKLGFEITNTSKWAKKSPSYFSNISRVMNFAKKATPDFELLLYGHSKCKSQGKVADSNLFSARASIHISLIDIHTGILLATSELNNAAAHIDFNTACSDAISEITPQISDSLYTQLIRKWNREYGSGKTIILEVNGHIKYRALYELQNQLRNEFRGVVEVLEKNVTPNKTVLHVIFKGQTKDFLEELTNKKTKPKLKIIERNGNKIATKVIRK